MKIKISLIMKFVYVLLILLQFSFFKLLGNQIPIFSTEYDQYPMVIFYVACVVFLLILGSVYAVRATYLKTTCILCFAASCLGIYNAISENGVELMTALSIGIEYIYLMIAIPLYYLLVWEKWDFRKLLNLLLIFGVGAYAIRWGISFYCSISGTVVFGNIARESASSGWIRNGILRVNPPFIGIIIVPIAYYLATTVTKTIHKTLYYLSIIIVVAYTIQVHQARSLMIYQLMTIVILFEVEKVNDKKKLLRMAVLLVGIIVLVNTEWFGSLVDSFSESNADYGGSTTARINALAFFGARYLNSPIFGIGFLERNSQKLTTISGDISDIGMLRSVFMLGIPIIIVFIMIFIRGFYVYNKANKAGMQNEALLVLGMTISVIMTGINIDLFVGIFSFGIPFYMAITEYVLYKSRECEDIEECGGIWET